MTEIDFISKRKTKGDETLETIDDTKHSTVFDEAEFEYDWLNREKYQFKVLALIAVLANNHLAYRGTLADMCDFFGVASGNNKTNKKLKAAIDKLEADGLLKKIVDGWTFTLTLSKAAEKKSRVIRIQKEWVGYATNYHQEAIQTNHDKPRNPKAIFFQRMESF